ncbi:MAG: hypothetical protein EB072_18155 [Betaproteobacteria bacterium]|nr:hypothetical protein [Betaproteobacteria bacterium]
MPATNYTPIQLYRSSSATVQPTAANLQAGELAINFADGRLFYKDNAGTPAVQIIGTRFGANKTIGETIAAGLSASTGVTGTGALAFATSPTFTTPVLGVATATTINKVTFTQPASGSTLTIANGKTLTASNSITLAGTDSKTLTVNNSIALAGTDSTTMTFPPASSEIGYLNVPQNGQSTAYTTVLADAGKLISHPSTDANARTFTIDNGVAYPLGTVISFSNMTTQNVTINLSSGTLYWSNTSPVGTGSRTLGQYGLATAVKIETNVWFISGSQLT